MSPLPPRADTMLRYVRASNNEDANNKRRGCAVSLREAWREVTRAYELTRRDIVFAYGGAESFARIKFAYAADESPCEFVVLLVATSPHRETVLRRAIFLAREHATMVVSLTWFRDDPSTLEDARASELRLFERETTFFAEGGEDDDDEHYDDDDERKRRNEKEERNDNDDNDDDEYGDFSVRIFRSFGNNDPGERTLEHKIYRSFFGPLMAYLKRFTVANFTDMALHKTYAQIDRARIMSLCDAVANDEARE